MIEILEGSELDSNTYIVKDEKILVIDPGIDSKKILKTIDPKHVDIIINTHAHIDHCLNTILFENAEVMLHREDVKEAEKGSFYGTWNFINKKVNIKVDKELKGNEIIETGKHRFRVIHTPGHTHGSICLFEEKEKILITGDLVFAGGFFGRTDLGGNPRELINSLKRILKIDFKDIYPGHGGIAGREDVEDALLNAKYLFETELE